MPCELMNFVIAFAPLFSKPVFNRVKVLVRGAILSPASRTVANAFRVMGLSQERNFQNYHRVLNRAWWSCLASSRTLLNQLLKAFGGGGGIIIGFDDTTERRRGRQIKAKGIYRDAVRSSKSFFVKCVPRGLRWLSFMLLSEIPFAKKVWSIAVFDCFVSVAKIRSRERDSASEINRPCAASDFVDQALVARKNFSFCRRAAVLRHLIY